MLKHKYRSKTTLNIREAIVINEDSFDSLKRELLNYQKYPCSSSNTLFLSLTTAELIRNFISKHSNQVLKITYGTSLSLVEYSEFFNEFELLSVVHDRSVKYFSENVITISGSLKAMQFTKDSAESIIYLYPSLGPLSPDRRTAYLDLDESRLTGSYDNSTLYLTVYIGEYLLFLPSGHIVPITAEEYDKHYRSCLE